MQEIVQPSQVMTNNFQFLSIVLFYTNLSLSYEKILSPALLILYKPNYYNANFIVIKSTSALIQKCVKHPFSMYDSNDKQKIVKF